VNRQKHHWGPGVVGQSPPNPTPHHAAETSSSSLSRDGRVSENTVCLIRKLLVLDPQQRLAAADVLEALSAIIASW
jgi:hypothetical protein